MPVPAGASDLDGCENGLSTALWSFLRFRASPPPITTGPARPTTDGSIQYDNNGNNDGTGQTISAGNRVTFDDPYHYQFDATRWNCNIKYKSDKNGAGLLGHGHHQVHLGSTATA